MESLPKSAISKKQSIELSKTLSYLLRHGAEKHKLNMRSNGYVRMDEILKNSSLKSSYNVIILLGKQIKLSDILHVVETNDKKRFEVMEEEDQELHKPVLWIRASQGHTIKTLNEEELLKKIEDASIYDVVIHGTFSKCIDSIMEKGLNKMQRNHIHFAAGHPGEKGVISGMRSSCDVIIEIDIEKAMADGIPFYVSSNDVILTSGIEGILDRKYFRKVFCKGVMIHGEESHK